MLYYSKFSNHNKIKNKLHFIPVTIRYALEIFKKKLTHRKISSLFKVTVTSNAARFQIKSLL